MIPNDSNADCHNPRKGCTPVSSSCVIWNGPDIPCINLCKGDAIDEVVYQLALKLCQVTEGVLDITTLDFKCLVAENATEPTRLIAILQLIIDKHCELAAAVEQGGGGGGTTPNTPEIIANLPECLQFTNADGDLVTSLPIDEYSELLANQICGILTTIAGLTSNYTNLVNRVESIEEFIANLNLNGTIPTVVSKCITAVMPNVEVPVTEAVSAMEAFLCQLIDLLGDFSQLSALIDTECPDLDNTPTLSDPEVLMNELGGWTVDPANLSQNLTNLWLTLCDMRGAVSNLLEPPVLPCAPVSPSNVQITNLTLGGCTISWNPPATTGVQTPSAYLVTVVQWNGTSEVGLPIASETVTFGTNTLAVTGADPTKIYRVTVVAVYENCGYSLPAEAIGACILTSYIAKLSISEVSLADAPPVTCGGIEYAVDRRTATFKLINLATGAPVINTGAPITIVAAYTRTNDCISGDYNVSIVIPTGQSFGTYTYFAETTVSCAPDSCGSEYRTFNCIQSIDNPNIALDAGINFC